MLGISFELALAAAAIFSSGAAILAFGYSAVRTSKRLEGLERNESELRSHLDLMVRARTRDNREIIERLEILSERIESLEVPESTIRSLAKEKARAHRR